MTKAEEAIEQLMSEGACLIDEGAVRNTEDNETMACIIISVALRDKIVAILRTIPQS